MSNKFLKNFPPSKETVQKLQTEEYQFRLELSELLVGLNIYNRANAKLYSYSLETEVVKSLINLFKGRGKVVLGSGSAATMRIVPV